MRRSSSQGITLENRFSREAVVSCRRIGITSGTYSLALKRGKLRILDSTDQGFSRYTQNRRIMYLQRGIILHNPKLNENIKMSWMLSLFAQN